MQLVRCYVVEIQYREPTYELRVGPKKHPYSMTYKIHTTSEDSAAAKAIAEFERITEVSSVGWIREIVDVDVKRG